MQKTLVGKLRNWTLGNNRQFGSVVDLTFGDVSELFMPYRYNAVSGRGEQREINEPNLRKITKAIDEGNYTPTPISVGLRKKHRENLTIDGNTFNIVVNSDDPLPMTDGGHRVESLARKVKGLQHELKSENLSEKDRATLQEKLDEILAQPMEATIYLDGDTQIDFINLQAGKTVDASHMLSLRMQKILDEPALKVAFEVAKLLNKQESSPFHNQIRFDSRGISALPIATVCANGSSDLATSLIGLARVGLSADTPREAANLAFIVLRAFQTLTEKAPALLDTGKVLTTVANGGTKGSATALIGVAIALAYRMISLGHDLPTDEDLQQVVNSAKYTLDESVNGNFSGPTKRRLMGFFAKDFFSDLTVDKHEGLPISLLRTLSASAYGVSQLPKVPKTRKRAATVAAEQPVATETVPQAPEVSEESTPVEAASRTAEPAPAVQVSAAVAVADPWEASTEIQA